MKNAFSFLAALSALLCLAACNRQNLDVTPSVDGGTSLLTLKVGNMTATKAGDQSTNDVTINSVQVFVFNKDTGQLDNCKKENFPAVTDGCQLSPIECTVGEKEIWAVVNWPVDLTSAAENILTLNDFKSRTAVLADNRLDNLLMSGYIESKSLKAGNDAATIDVTRLCAAVVLTQVTNRIEVAAYRDKFQVVGAYLMNVPGVQRVDGTILASGADCPKPSAWYAWYKKATTSEPQELLAETFLPAPPKTAYGESYGVYHTFYTFANDFNYISGGTADGGLKSSTYLVVECKVDGVDCIYPVVLPSMVRNKKYNVKLTVNHVGGDPDQPWEKIQLSSFTPSISITSWGSQDVEETI